jgi:hypothetical protein
MTFNTFNADWPAPRAVLGSDPTTTPTLPLKTKGSWASPACRGSGCSGLALRSVPSGRRGRLRPLHIPDAFASSAPREASCGRVAPPYGRRQTGRSGRLRGKLMPGLPPVTPLAHRFAGRRVRPAAGKGVLFSWVGRRSRSARSRRSRTRSGRARGAQRRTPSSSPRADVPVGDVAFLLFPYGEDKAWRAATACIPPNFRPRAGLPTVRCGAGPGGCRKPAFAGDAVQRPIAPPAALGGRPTTSAGRMSGRDSRGDDWAPRSVSS